MLGLTHALMLEEGLKTFDVKLLKTPQFFIQLFIC